MQTKTNLNFNVVNGFDNFFIQANLTESPTGTDFNSGTQSAPTASWAAVSMGSCVSVDLVCIKNLDTANYVRLAVANDNSGVFARLTPGRVAFWPLETGVTLFAKANVTVVQIMVQQAEP